MSRFRVEKGGRTIYRRKPKPKRVLSADSCRDLTEALRETLRVATVAGGGGKALSEEIAIAGKTGTSDDVADAWFVGYGSDVTVAVWIGFPEGNRTILKDEGGNSLAFPVWKKIVSELPDHYEWKSLPELERSSDTLHST